MKRTYSHLAATVCLAIFSCIFMQAQIIDTKEGPFVENDTTFLRKIYYQFPNESHTHSLYIETDRNSEEYQEYLRTLYDADSEIPQLLSSAGTVCRKYGELSADSAKKLNGIYLPLHKYRGKYYLYNSSACKTWKQIESPFLICQYQDGPYLYGITHIEQTSASSYHLQTDDCINNMYNSVKALDIYIIDEEKGIYVWKSQTEKEVCYDLYVEKSKAGAFDLINWLVIELGDEFDKFEPIDYEEIIRQKKLF